MSKRKPQRSRARGIDVSQDNPSQEVANRATQVSALRGALTSGLAGVTLYVGVATVLLIQANEVLFLKIIDPFVLLLCLICLCVGLVYHSSIARWSQKVGRLLSRGDPGSSVVFLSLATGTSAYFLIHNRPELPITLVLLIIALVGRRFFWIGPRGLSGVVGFALVTVSPYCAWILFATAPSHFLSWTCVGLGTALWIAADSDLTSPTTMDAATVIAVGALALTLLPSALDAKQAINQNLPPNAPKTLVGLSRVEDQEVAPALKPLTQFEAAYAIYGGAKDSRRIVGVIIPKSRAQGDFSSSELPTGGQWVKWYFDGHYESGCTQNWSGRGSPGLVHAAPLTTYVGVLDVIYAAERRYAASLREADQKWLSILQKAESENRYYRGSSGIIESSVPRPQIFEAYPNNSLCGTEDNRFVYASIIFDNRASPLALNQDERTLDARQAQSEVEAFYKPFRGAWPDLDGLAGRPGWQLLLATILALLAGTLLISDCGGFLQRAGGSSNR